MNRIFNKTDYLAPNSNLNFDISFICSICSFIYLTNTAEHIDWLSPGYIHFYQNQLAELYFPCRDHLQPKAGFKTEAFRWPWSFPGLIYVSYNSDQVPEIFVLFCFYCWLYYRCPSFPPTPVPPFTLSLPSPGLPHSIIYVHGLCT